MSLQTDSQICQGMRQTENLRPNQQKNKEIYILLGDQNIISLLESNCVNLEEIVNAIFSYLKGDYDSVIDIATFNFYFRHLKKHLHNSDFSGCIDIIKIRLEYFFLSIFDNSELIIEYQKYLLKSLCENGDYNLNKYNSFINSLSIPLNFKISLLLENL